MTATITEIENDLDHDGIHDPDEESSIPEMFRSTSGILDSLEKLTNEIRANLASTEDPGSVTGSDESPSNDDEDFYWDDEDNDYSDDDDPDSGENKLFSMMDDLVEELKKELNDDSFDHDERESHTLVEKNDENISNRDEPTFTVEPENENTNDDKNTTRSNDSGPPELICTSSEDCISTVSNLNSNQPIDDRAEKHKKLHQHVKTLLRQVTEMTDSLNATKRKAVKKNHDDKIISANIQKKIEEGDSDAHRLENLMDSVSNHEKFKDPCTNGVASLSSPSQVRYMVKIKKKKRKKRTNKHKRRKPKSFIQTQQSIQILHAALIELDEKLSQEHLPRH